MDTARFGATAKGGICRLTLTDSRPRKCATGSRRNAKRSACTVTVDEVGNMFARRPGKNPALCRRSPWARISTPSRPAASSTACSACWPRSKPCARCVAAGYETNAPVEIVNWTNEEGARFAPPMLASGVFAGVFSPRLRLCAHRPRRQNLRRRARAHRLPGRRNSRRAHTFSAMFELHIEQGPILEAEGRTHRHRAGRARHALVRGHRDGPGSPHRRHADAAAQERARSAQHA